MRMESGISVELTRCMELIGCFIGPSRGQERRHREILALVDALCCFQVVSKSFTPGVDGSRAECMTLQLPWHHPHKLQEVAASDGKAYARNSHVYVHLQGIQTENELGK